MALSAPRMLQAARPLVRVAAAGSGSATLRSAAAGALRRLEAMPGAPAMARHPLSPAAVRFERAHSTRRGRHADQTAVTVWFGEGPALPGPGGGDTLRSAMRIGTGVLGAAALAAMTVIAARREEARRVIDAPARPVDAREQTS